MDRQRQVVPGGFFAAAVLVSITSLVTACGFPAAASAPKGTGPEATAAAVAASQAREQRIQLAEQAVRNGSYELPDFGAVQLHDGSYQEKFGEGASQVKRAGVVTVAFGDLDGDAVEDAAVVLWTNTGGSGTFLYLAPVLNRAGQGQQAGAHLLGDRAQIKSLTVGSGKIKVEVLGQSAGDPMVSPAFQGEQEYAVQGGTLTRLTPDAPAVTPPSRPAPQPTAAPAVTAPAGLAGTIWTWQRLVSSGEQGSFPVPYPGAYRLELLADGTLQFQADCNRGSGGYTLEGSRLTLAPGSMTRAECQTGSRSQQFVSLLGQAGTYVLNGDALVLNLKMDAGDLVFSRLNAVTGRITGPAGEAAPDGATAEVMVVSKDGTRIGGVLVKAQLPMSFDAPFNPANLDPSASYLLEVTIRDAQKQAVFRNARPYPAVTQGNPTYHLDVEVVRVP